jgi:hypothetical protein
VDYHIYITKSQPQSLRFEHITLHELDRESSDADCTAPTMHTSPDMPEPRQMQKLDYPAAEKAARPSYQNGREIAHALTPRPEYQGISKRVLLV